MNSIPVLNREIDQRVTRLRNLNKDLETRAMTEAEKAEVDSLKQELDQRQAELEQRKYLAQVEADSIRPDAPDIQKAKRQFSVRRAILGQMQQSKIDDGLEREVSAEFARNTNTPTEGIWCPVDQQRAVTTTTPSAGPGSNLVSTDHLGSQFVPLLRPSLVAQQIPITRLTAKGNLQVPRAKAGVTGKFLGETASLSSEDSQYETVSASPKRVGALSSFSYQMMLQSDPSIESLVVSDINERLQRVVDKVVLYGKNDTVTAGNTQTGYGSGTFTLAQWTGHVGNIADQFEGIANGVTPATPSGTVTNGKAISVDDIAKLKTELDKEDIPMDGRYFLISPALYNKLSVTLEFASSGSQPIGRGMTVRGMPTVVSNAIVSNRTKGSASGSLSDMIYVHAPSYVLVSFDAVQILVNPYADADYKAGRVSVRAQAYLSAFKRYSSTDICQWYNQCITAI